MKGFAKSESLFFDVLSYKRTFPLAVPVYSFGVGSFILHQNPASP